MSSSECSGRHPVARDELARVADEHGHVDGAHEVGRGDDSQRTSGAAHEALGQIADAHPVTRAHVVDLAGDAAIGEQRVRAHDVAHVGEVAHGIAVAERDLVGAPRARRAATRAARPGTRNAGDWPGPVWLNARVHTTASPCIRCASSATASAATLLFPYGLTGRHSVCSSTGIAAGSTVPYCSELPTTTTRATPAATHASTTARVPSTFTWVSSSPSDHDAPTWLRAARWYTTSGDSSPMRRTTAS